MPDATSAFEFLARETMPAIPPVCVLFGDEPLLKRESLERLRAVVLSGEDAEMSFTSLDGDKVELREVLDELATVSMFGGGRRMVAVVDADDFVSGHRQLLEEYCEKPRAASVLVLEVDSWPANTRLFKKVAEIGLQINCNLPKGRFGDIDDDVVLEWLAARTEKLHEARLGNGAGEMLLEIVGPELGRLDQELAKLSLLAEEKAEGRKQKAEDDRTLATDNGQRTTTDSQRTKDKGAATGRRVISRELVEQTVGGWRAKTAWTMIEAVLEGNAAEALVQLDRLLLAGEEPIALLAMMSGSLRRLTAATRIIEQAETERRRISLSDALRDAGVSPKKFVLDKAERQLRQITRHRARHIYQWLLEADLALKGTSSSGDRARLVLEELIVRLSRQLAPKTGVR